MSNCIWIQTRHRLIMELTLDMTVYNNSNLQLPPTELGKCTEWRFELSPDEKFSNFRAVWDKRRLHIESDLLQNILHDIEQKINQILRVI